MGFEGIGVAVRHKEDHRFLSGGNYTDDINRPGQLYAVIRRSDALRAYGVRHLGMPATAETIWSIIHSKQPQMAAE